MPNSVEMHPSFARLSPKFGNVQALIFTFLGQNIVWQLATGFFWTGLGLFLYQLLPNSWPKKLGRSLYWVGVPLQVLGLAHGSDFATTPWVPPITMIAVLILGLATSILCLRGLKEFLARHLKLPKSLAAIELETTTSLSKTRLFSQLVHWCHLAFPKDNPSRGSFILSAMLGNTIFIGLAVIPSLVNPAYLGWIIIYGVAHYLLGSYGMGVILASYFGRSRSQQHWLVQCRDVLTVPALWAFALGLLTQPFSYPQMLDLGLQAARWAGVPAVFILLGMQLGKFRGVKALETATIPAVIKILILPAIAGLGLTFFGVHGDARLTLVLMAGMPTNSANLILAEEYNLDSQLAAGSILLSTIALPLLLPLWMALF
jgi:malate permease and related proteins